MTVRSRAGFIAATTMLTLGGLRPVRAQSLPVLRVGAAPADAFAQAWFAQDLGFFTKAGLTVDLQNFNSGTAAASAVVGGSLDIAITTPIPLANAVARGVPFVIFASAAVNTPKAPQALICVRKSGSIRGAADLAGKTIGVNSLKTLLQLVLDVYLTKYNVPTSQVRVVELSLAEAGAAIDRGTIDGAVLSEPFISSSLKSHDVRVLVDPWSIIGPRFVSAAWFTTRPFAERNVEAIKRYANVMYDTARWANRNHATTAPIVAKYTKMVPEDVGSMIRADFAEQTRIGEIQPLLDACAKFGYIPRPMLASELVLK